MLHAVGRRRDGTTACRAETRTSGPPAAIRLSVDRDTITTSAGYVAHVSFEIVDSAGIVVPTSESMVRITAGGGKVLVVDNANLLDLHPYRADQRRAFSGRGLAILNAGKPGALRVTASSPGLRSSSVRVQVMSGAVLQTLPAARRN